MNPVDQELSLAMQAFRAGDAPTAMARVDRLLPDHSGRFDVLMAKGVLLVTTGSHGEGLDYLSRSLDIRGDVPESLSWAAHAALELKDFARAEEFSGRFANLDPNNPRAHHLLARALAGQGRSAEALAAVERSLALTPNDPAALATQARILKNLNMPGLAAEVFQRSMSILPDPRVAIELAQTLMPESRPAEALAVLEKVAPMIPEHLRPYDLLAQIQTELRQFAEAEQNWELAERYLGGRAAIRQRRATAEIAIGNFELAESILHELLSQDGGAGQSFYLLTLTRKMSADDQPLLHRMERLLASGSLAPEDSVGLAFGLGKAFDDLKDYEKAIGFFDTANEISYRLFLDRSASRADISSAQRYHDARIQYFSDKLLSELRAKGNPSRLPILVMGMIRSGTTLTASILSAHSQIAGGHENSFWTERSVLFERWEGGEFGVNFDLTARFVDDYLELLRREGPAAIHVVDKTPGNAKYAALLNGLLPNVKMLHLLRHPVDNALSIWMTRLHIAGSFKSNRRNIVETYRHHLRLLRHFQAVLPPDRFSTVSYESLTAEPEAAIGRVLDFLELEHEDACFHPETGQRTVRTPSVGQVRQPIHTASQQRWKNYEPWLGEFRELLDLTESA